MTLIDDLTHNPQDVGQRWLRRQTLGQAINRDVELHGGTDDTLQQCVMELLGDSRSFRQSLFKAEI
jgi:hypothetical protein